ncbi:MAG: hypothetical protein ABF242_05970, partial [Flavobacteriales bacterium]
MLNRIVVFFLFGIFFIACDVNPDVDQNTETNREQLLSIDLDWLQGVWVDSTSFRRLGQTYVENWDKVNNDSYIGMKYAIKNGRNGDTTIMKIAKNEGRFYLTIQKPKNPAVFMEVQGVKNQILFSNTKDEFPYDRQYTLVGNNLKIVLSGNLNGIPRKINYNTLKHDA